MDRALAVFDALAKHPRLDVLATIVGEEAQAIASARSYTGWPETAKTKLDALGLSEDEGTTPFGDLRALLRRGPETEGDAHLLSALAAHALAGAPLDDDAAQTKAATDLLWLAANTPFVALAHLDRALGDELADGMWGAIAARVRRVETSQLARAEALVGAAAIASSSSRVAKKLAARLRREVSERCVKAALGRGEGAVLINHRGVRFMASHHPQADLAPRDAVARAIDQEMKSSGEPCVYLDLRHLDRGMVEQLFPNLVAACRRYGIDMFTADMVQ